MKILDVEKNENIVWIIMPFCEHGDLNHFYRGRDFSPETNLEVMKQIAAGIDYLHSQSKWPTYWPPRASLALRPRAHITGSPGNNGPATGLMSSITPVPLSENPTVCQIKDRSFYND